MYCRSGESLSPISLLCPDKSMIFLKQLDGYDFCIKNCFSDCDLTKEFGRCRGGNIKHVSFFDMDLVIDYAFSSKKAIIFL